MAETKPNPQDKLDQLGAVRPEARAYLEDSTDLSRWQLRSIIDTFNTALYGQNISKLVEQVNAQIANSGKRSMSPLAHLSATMDTQNGLTTRFHQLLEGIDEREFLVL